MCVNTSFEFSRGAQLLRMTQARHATSQNIDNWRPFEKNLNLTHAWLTSRHPGFRPPLDKAHRPRWRPWRSPPQRTRTRWPRLWPRRGCGNTRPKPTFPSGPKPKRPSQSHCYFRTTQERLRMTRASASSRYFFPKPANFHYLNFINRIVCRFKEGSWRFHENVNFSQCC